MTRALIWESKGNEAARQNEGGGRGCPQPGVQLMPKQPLGFPAAAAAEQRMGTPWIY